MEIKSLKTSGYGSLSTVSIDFNCNGLNIILGANATGKTQIFGAIRASIEGKRFLQKKTSETKSIIKTTIEDNGKVYELGFNYDKSKNLCVMGANNSFIKGLHQYLSFDNTPNMFIGEQDAHQGYKANKSKISKKNIETLSSNIGKEIVSEYSNSNNKTYSDSMRFLYLLISEYLLRTESNLNIPLVLDSRTLAMLDSFGNKTAWGLINLLAKKHQVIVFATNHPKELSKNIVLLLEQRTCGLPSSIYYHYNAYPLQPKNKFAKHNYSLGEELIDDEDISTEYKEVKGSNPVNSIKDIADQYVVAFLNSPSQEGGRIIWGIDDSNKKVKGVTLSYSQRDDLRRNLINKLHDIQPVIPPSCYRVKMHQVANKGKVVDDLYVVEICVYNSKNKFLFCTSKKDVFIKTDAGKKKLTPYELQLEYGRRNRAGS